MLPDVIRPVVMVVEPEAVIALAVSDALSDAGFDVAGPFATCRDSLFWLQTSTPDLALLDTEMTDGPCRDLVEASAARGVPVLIHSGRYREAPGFKDLHAVPWVEKPSSMLTLLSACRALLHLPDATLDAP